LLEFDAILAKAFNERAGGASGSNHFEEKFCVECRLEGGSRLESKTLKKRKRNLKKDNETLRLID
jgi:hypothetical protein